jgi:hypothetical protein
MIYGSFLGKRAHSQGCFLVLVDITRYGLNKARPRAREGRESVVLALRSLGNAED